MQTTASPAEKVLQLAQELPATRPQLEEEAARVDGLLARLGATRTQTGTAFNEELISVLELHLDGVLGLLDYDLCGEDEVLQQSLACLVESDSRLSQLESQITEVRYDLPLVA